MGEENLERLVLKQADHIAMNLVGSKKRLCGYVIETNLMQALHSRAFALAVLGTVIVLAAGVFTDLLNAFRSETLLENGFHIHLVQKAVESDSFQFAFSILCALPYTASYMDDSKCGYIKFYLARCKRSHYILGKLIACMVSGGLALVIGILIFFGIAAIVFYPMELAPVSIQGMAVNQADDMSELAEWLLPFLQKLVLIYLSGGFLSLTGMAASTLFSSRYMAYSAPFILYYLLIILCERYMKDCYVLYPKEWLKPVRFPYGWGGAAILLIELSALLVGFFYLMEERRLRQL